MHRIVFNSLHRDFSGSWSYFLQTGNGVFPVGAVAVLAYILPQAIREEQAQ